MTGIACPSSLFDFPSRTIPPATSAEKIIQLQEKLINFLEKEVERLSKELEVERSKPTEKKDFPLAYTLYNVSD